MFDKSLITIEVANKDIKILAGNKNRIKCFGAIKTPEEAFVDDKIVNVQQIAKSISAFLRHNGIGIKDVSFAVQGQDIVIRHMETPIMDRKGIMKTLQWEVSQYLPDAGENYYFDYEITDKINSKEKRAYKVMVVSVPKVKIDSYIELAKKLKLNLSAIDIAPNNVCRVFRNVHKLKDDIESIGVMQIGTFSSTFTVIDNGKLFIEREVPFGINTVSSTVQSEDNASPAQDIAATLLSDFNLYNNDGNEFYNSVKSRFESVLSTFDMVIQFYTTGKAKKTLDMIYIIGEGADIKGLDTYVHNKFSTPVEIADDLREIGIKMKLPKEFKFKDYVNTLGLQLRKE